MEKQKNSTACCGTGMWKKPVLGNEMKESGKEVSIVLPFVYFYSLIYRSCLSPLLHFLCFFLPASQV